MTRILIAVALIAGCFASLDSAHAATTKEDYELLERCGKRAEELFKREWGSGISKTGETTTMGSYTNHYNKKLNKCFYLETSTALTPKGKNKGTSEQMGLYDINENKEYGQFFKNDSDKLPFVCNVQGAECRSKQEWDSLIRPFMNE